MSSSARPVILLLLDQRPFLSDTDQFYITKREDKLLPFIIPALY